VNLSFGGSALETAPPRVLQRVLSALPADVLVVCSAGNFADTRPHWPGAFAESLPGVVCVGAIDPEARVQQIEGSSVFGLVLADFSTRGPWVSVYADGIGLEGPYCWFTESRSSAARHDGPPVEFAGWAKWSGTSFATAVVTGRIAAYAIDNQLTTNPREAWAQLRAAAFTVGDGLGADKPYLHAQPVKGAVKKV
jgi:subtilisin family serine protease